MGALMDVLSAAAFANHLRSLDDAELAVFVADLWAARGFETAVRGATVVAERRGTESTTIQCGRGGIPLDSQVDTVVVASRQQPDPDDVDVRVIGPEDLREMLLYAVDRETAERLCRGHLGRSLRARPADTSLWNRLSGTPARGVLALGLVVILIAAAAVGASGGSLLIGVSGPAGLSTSASPMSDAEPPGSSTAGPSGPDSDLPAAGGSLFRYPPGVGPSGVTDVDALAAAHRSAVANTSWTLALDHEGSLDLVHPYRVWTESRQTIVRVNASRYEYQVTAVERAGNESLASVTYVDYGDGRYNYRRLIGLHGETYRRTQLPPGSDVFAAISAAYVHRYLSTTESRVETVRAGVGTRQRVIATGTPTAMARTVANYTAVAVVDRRGVVRSLTVEYTLLERVPDPIENGIATPFATADRVPTESRGTVRFELQFRSLGRTTLEPPGWYDAAVNATNGTDAPEWPTAPTV